MHRSAPQAGFITGPALVRRDLPVSGARPHRLRSHDGFTLVAVLVIVAVGLVVAVVIYLLCLKPHGPSVGYVEIVPTSVVATPEASLRLYARALDENREVVNVGGEVASWRSDPVGVAFSNIRGLWVEMELPPAAGPISVWAKVKGKESPPASVTVVASAATPGEDWARVKTGTGEVPAAVLMDAAHVGTACVTDMVVAVTEEGPIGDNLTDRTPCPNESAVFSASQAPVLRLAPNQVPWTDNAGDVLQQPTAALVQLSVYVWTAVPVDQASEVSNDADKDIDLANRLFSENRVGITIVRQVVTASQLDETTVDIADLYCSDAETLFNRDFDGMSVSAAVHVIYVTAIEGEDRGFTCLRDDAARADGLMFIAVEGRAATTLAHEVGHLLSLLLPPAYQGHTNMLHGFDQQNLMWGRISLDIAEARDHFSIGQVYRMHFDDNSFLNYRGVRSGGTRGACPCNPYDDVGPPACPVLSKDLIPRALGPSNPCP